MTLANRIRDAFDKRAERRMSSVSELSEPRSFNGRRPTNSRIKSPFQSWKAFLINHPRLVYDYIGIKFEPSSQVPRSAQFLLNGRPVVILFHTRDDNLPSAKGTIPKLETKLSFWPWLKSLCGFKKEKESLSGFRFLTADYIYTGGFPNDEEDNKIRFGPQTKTFVEAVGEGRLWHNPERMGPWEFGGRLSLHSLARQLTKHRHLALAKQLDSTVKWMIGGLIIAIIFAILFITQGGS